MKFAALVVVLVIALSSTGRSENPYYKCDPGTVDREARAVAYSTVAVGVHSDGQRHVCTFSIDAADPAGNPSSDGIAPIAEVLNRALEEDASTLASRIFVPRGEVDDKVTGILDEMLAKSSDDLEICLTALTQYETSDQPEPLENLDGGGLLYLTRDAKHDEGWIIREAYDFPDGAHARTRPFIEQALFSSSDRVCTIPDEERPSDHCRILVDLEPDDLRARLRRVTASA